MVTYIQANRPLTVTTPLGGDALLLVGLTGYEFLSRLFSFQLSLLARNRQEIAFDKLLGQKITAKVTLPNGGTRYFNGICNRVSQGERDHDFTGYRMEIVPQFWLLTRRAQSRIFQRQNVPDILAEVLKDVDVSFDKLCGKYEARDFCVQYRETDFNFASRLMEEEGIFYFFEHTEDGHKMILADSPEQHPDLAPASTLIYEDFEGGAREEERVCDWQKVQELRAGKYTLWDHTFELPHKHLEAEQTILESVQAGTVAHKLKVGENDKLEIYDWPGEYAQRFDGVDSGGGDQAAELDKIFEDNERTVGIRIQEEAAGGLIIQGSSNCRHLLAGSKFELERHYNADGQYVLTSVTHSASATSADYRSGGGEFQYQNNFTCIPAGLPFRPQRLTPKPVVQGTQTAVVVGPAGEEIFTDKYGRVKVQFHWDRQGKNDANSSCWIRVSQPWAGIGWGGISIPRIGQEVIVDFLEGDPDRPIIVGRVYNAQAMPPYPLPAGMVVSGLKSQTHKGQGYNELSMDDTAGQEKITIHAQYDMGTTVEHDDTQTVHNNRIIAVDGTHTETIKKATQISVTEGTFAHDVVANTATYHVKGALTENYDDTQTTTVLKDITIDSKTKILITATNEIKLLTGESMIVMKSDGTIQIHGVKLEVIGTAEVKSGVHTQSVTLTPAKIETSAAAITTTAVGVHEISGALIKIN